MKYKIGDTVHFKIPMVYKQSSIEYRDVIGTITQIYSKLNAYDILPEEYDTAQYVPSHNIYGEIRGID